MSKLTRALFSALVVLAILQTTNCGKFGGRSSGGGGRHSYPSSRGGLSGGHGYSGSGGSHGYPGGGSSGGSHAYPGGGSSGGSHGYPGGSSSGGSHGYPAGGLSGSGSRGGHGYPPTGGLSGSNTAGGSQSHGYPTSHKGGLSGGGAGYPATQQKPHTTVINHNYNYSPPQTIRYSAPGQTAAHSYPVYHGPPPTYVMDYKRSDSKYGTLLAGLALLNLGTLGASVYAASKAGSNSGSGSANTQYKPIPGEYCKFGIKKDNGDYEETRIDCNLITSFIFQDQQKTPQAAGTNSVVTTTVTNVTVVNMTNGVPDATTTQAPQLYQKLPDGSLVPVNITLPNSEVNGTQNGTAPDASQTSSTIVTTTTTNTTVVNALDVKGDPVKVTPGMQCFLIRHTPTNDMRKTVDCGLLQSYADQSLSPKKPNSAAKNVPAFTVLCAVLAFMFH